MNGSSRGKGKHRGRNKKKACENNAKPNDSLSNTNDEKLNEQDSITIDLDADITQLEAPTFSTINKGPPEPMLRLNWDHKTHLIGEKVINPMIHCCDKCEAPILVYGRMIPCKHVFCFCCAERQNKTCPRCHDKIVRIEKTGLGTVFMCTFGGTRYGSNGCRRTYLSQRDLMAHINHRHIVGINNKKESTNNNRSSINVRPSVPFCAPPSRPKAPVVPHPMAVGDPRKHNTAGHDHDFKTLPPSSHSTLPQSSYRQQSQHPVHLSAPTPVPHPQRHVSSTPQSSSMTPIDYSNPMLVTNYSSPTSTPISNVRNNVMSMPVHKTNMEPRGVSMNMPMAPNFAHQSYPSQFHANPPSNTAFSVPPPIAAGVNIVPQTLAQFYPNNAINYSTSLTQRPNSMQYTNSQTSMINQPRMIVNSSSNTPRRPQYLGEATGPPLPVPPPQRWHQVPSNQTHFY